MIVDFSITNFGPFRDKVTFSMNSTELKDSEYNLIDCGIGDSLLSSAVIYGPNASGKSYLMRAMVALQQLVFAPLPANFKIAQYQSFRASSKTIQAPVSFNINYICDGKRFEYSISYDIEKIVSESLGYYGSKKKTLIFERDGQNFKTCRQYAKELNVSSRMTAPNSSFLAVAAQFNNELCRLAHKGIVSDIVVIDGSVLKQLDAIMERLNNDPERMARMVNALRIADLGISDMKGTITTKKVSEMRQELPPQIINILNLGGMDSLRNTTLYLAHDFKDCDINGGHILFPYLIESRGTLQIIGLMDPLIDALENGRTIMIDEFGSFLHSDICRWIIKQFRSSGNPHQAQLIVNTHDQLLMDLELFRRDQIWFVNRNMDLGVSELYCLSDFNGIRAESDIQKRYDAGKFEAKPFIREENLVDFNINNC